jgi:hypothetical protein
MMEDLIITTLLITGLITIIRLPKISNNSQGNDREKEVYRSFLNFLFNSENKPLILLKNSRPFSLVTQQNELRTYFANYYCFREITNCQLKGSNLLITSSYAGKENTTSYNLANNQEGK